MLTIPRVVFAMVFALCFASPSWAAGPRTNSGAQSVDEAWRKAMTANSLNDVMACYSKDAVMWLPGGPEAKGTDAIRRSYSALLGANTVTGASFANTHYQTSDRLSVGWGDFVLNLAPKAGGSPVTISGRFSVIAKKDGGKWSYVVDHASAPASSQAR